MGKVLRIILLILFIPLGAIAVILAGLAFYNSQPGGGVMLSLQALSFGVAVWHLMFCRACGAPADRPKGRYAWFGPQ